jgi:hypothetical protein
MPKIRTIALFAVLVLAGAFLATAHGAVTHEYNICLLKCHPSCKVEVTPPSGGPGRRETASQTRGRPD